MCPLSQHQSPQSSKLRTENSLCTVETMMLPR